MCIWKVRHWGLMKHELSLHAIVFLSLVPASVQVVSGFSDFLLFDPVFLLDLVSLLLLILLDFSQLRHNLIILVLFLYYFTFLYDSTVLLEQLFLLIRTWLGLEEDTFSSMFGLFVKELLEGQGNELVFLKSTQYHGVLAFLIS